MTSGRTHSHIPRPRDAFARTRDVLLLKAALATVAVVLCACGAPRDTPPENTRDIAFATSDGVEIAATVYPVDAPKPPGLVLLHMLGADRREWEPFALRAQRAGYLCLAFDIRGHGDSRARGDESLSYRQFNTADWRAAVEDVGAAKRALLEQGADPDNLALVGASIGANLALAYAVGHEDIPAVVLVSPGLGYKGVKTEEAIVAYGRRPVLLMTSKGDSYSAMSCTTLKRAAPGLCELREYKGATHGTALFDVSVTAIQQVFLWLKPIIGPQEEDDRDDERRTTKD